MVLQVENLGYWYTNERPLFQQVNLTFEPRKMYAILGTSGSGKNYLFYPFLAGFRSTQRRAKSLIKGESLKTNWSSKTIAKNRVFYRLFKAYNLLPYLSAVEKCINSDGDQSDQKKDNPKEYAYKNS